MKVGNHNIVCRDCGFGFITYELVEWECDMSVRLRLTCKHCDRQEDVKIKVPKFFATEKYIQSEKEKEEEYGSLYIIK